MPRVCRANTQRLVQSTLGTTGNPTSSNRSSRMESAQCIEDFLMLRKPPDIMFGENQFAIDHNIELAWFANHQFRLSVKGVFNLGRETHSPGFVVSNMTIDDFDLHGYASRPATWDFTTRLASGPRNFFQPNAHDRKFFSTEQLRPQRAPRVEQCSPQCCQHTHKKNPQQCPHVFLLSGNGLAGRHIRAGFRSIQIGIMHERR